jgi:hypothetical protein
LHRISVEEIPVIQGTRHTDRGPEEASMSHWAERHKPAATASTHLLMAWLMWALVGAGLAAFGATWLLKASPRAAPWLAGAAAAVGVLKSKLVLDRAARRVVARIRERGDGRCLGGFLSWHTWALVLVMMAAGRLLRGAGLSGLVVGPLYIAVGFGLLVSSRLSWREWRSSRRAGRR